MDPRASILISGAGVAGLTAAIWLGRHGFRPVVVERAADVRADGYIISLSHRSYAFADRLGLLPEIRERYAGVEASSYHRGDATLLEFDYSSLFTGVDVVQIMRDDLQDILYRQARDLAEFRFDTSIEHIAHHADGADVRLSDGAEQRFDVVIGADGLHSNVRELSLPAAAVERRHLGLASAAFRLPNIAGLEQKFETHMERDRYMVIFTTPSGGLAAVFVWAERFERAPPPAKRAAHLDAAYAGAPHLVREVLDHCPADGAFYMDPLIQIRTPRWYRDRTVLAGDAAHCLTLISGQGATMAFTGACVLAEQLVATDADRALAAYQADLQHTVFDLQDRTRAISRWYVPRSWWRQQARDVGMWLFPTTLFERHFKTKYSRA